MTAYMTGTGLDRLVEIIRMDAGIERKVSASDVQKGAEAAGEMNHMIVDGIRELGLANDGTIDGSDAHAIGDWIRADTSRYADFVRWHGNDGNGEETGFHLVQGNNAKTELFGRNAVNLVAEGIYNMGFGTDTGAFKNEDGERDVSIALTASWIDQLLSDADMKALSNPDAGVGGTTGTGLDELISVIKSDPGLIRNISRQDIAVGAKAADGLNHMYLDGIKALGLANDGSIDSSDAIAIGDWIQMDANRYADFIDLHGAEKGGVSTGFHLVLHKGAETAYVGVDDNVHPHVGHVVNHGLKGLYQVGLGTEKNFLLDHEGKPVIKVEIPAAWLDQMLTDADMAALRNLEADVDIEGTTGTGLDRIVEIINDDKGIIANTSRLEIAEGARAADSLNHMIADAIEALGVGRDNHIGKTDVREINDFIRSDPERYDEFVLLHGDDGNGVETGFHLVQGDNGKTMLFGRNAVNNVVEGLYQIGFEIEDNRFHDEDGDLGLGIGRVASWIDDLMFG